MEHLGEGEDRLVESGSHDELLAKPRSAYRQMWEVQSHSGGVVPVEKDVDEPEEVVTFKMIE